LPRCLGYAQHGLSPSHPRYFRTEDNHTGLVAEAIASGASSYNHDVVVRSKEVIAANYKRDVFEFADAVILGSPVINGNAAPSILEFINSFDFMDDLSGKVGSSFAVGGAAAAGLQPLIEQLNRGLMTFGMVLSGGVPWQNQEGVGIVMENGQAQLDSTSRLNANMQGARVAKLAAVAKVALAPTPAPAPHQNGPPPFGENWSAFVIANMTQVGYDAGVVGVNFTSSCGSDPSQQKAKTVYGDFDTVLTRCDLGKEFVIEPPARGGPCAVRTIGVDTDVRICRACACPFCTRDTNGTYSHGEYQQSKVEWEVAERKTINNIEVSRVLIDSFGQ
jgi:NAD(P)H dehydrogenase (quinone)